MAKHNEIGKIGEKIAQIYLIQKGFSIICLNFNCRQGEIDIIAKKMKNNENVSCEMDNSKQNNTKVGGNYVTHEINKTSSVEKIYFIEVKSKSVENFSEIADSDKDPFSPEKNFSHEKKRRMQKAINYYLFKNNLNLDIDCEVMLMIVYVNESLKKGRVKLYESVTLN